MVLTIKLVTDEGDGVRKNAQDLNESGSYLLLSAATATPNKSD